MKIESVKNVEIIRPLMEEWKKEEASDSFGITGSLEYALKEMTLWIEQVGSDVLVAWDREDEAVGFLALFEAPSMFGGGNIAVEKYWYVCPKSRENSLEQCGLHLVERAEVWARDRECTHLVMTASKVAGQLFDKVCRFYECVGFALVESSFVKEV